MSFFEVGGRPLRGMVGMRVVEACDVKAAAACFALDFYQLGGSDLIAVVGGIGADVSGGQGSFNEPSRVGLRKSAEQSTAALVRIGLFAVSADGFVNGAGEAEMGHWFS
jgi:hypothetical protein